MARPTVEDFDAAEQAAPAPELERRPNPHDPDASPAAFKFFKRREDDRIAALEAALRAKQAVAQSTDSNQ